MVNVNDLIVVDSDVVLNALLSPLPSRIFRLVTRRIDWAQKLDHAVLYGHFQVAHAKHSVTDPKNSPSSSPPSATGAASRESRQPRRMRLPVDKHRRLEVQRLAGGILNDSLSAF